VNKDISFSALNRNKAVTLLRPEGAQLMN